LRIERGRCVGIVAGRGSERFDIGAGAVVIADGGFPGDGELFRQHIGPRPDRVLMRHAGTAIGDGLKMAAAAGAATTRLDRFYGHLLSRDAMDNLGLWPYPQVDAVATAAIVVDRDGKRLLDEGLGGISIANDLARLNDPLCATVICDAQIWETAGKAAQIPPNPQLVSGGGTLHQADTLADLAEAAGLSRATLAETVAGYNAAVRDDRLSTLSPARSVRSGQPRAIETPPFFAIPICAGITNTMGGIAIDCHGRVRRPDSTTNRGPLCRRRDDRRARRRRRAGLRRRADQGLRFRAARRRGRRPVAAINIAAERASIATGDAVCSVLRVRQRRARAGYKAAAAISVTRNSDAVG
jgi:fumarate reductase flavoprotein subunit